MSNSGTEPAEPARPAVSVIVPFLGTDAEARDSLDALTVLKLRPGDELLIADNGSTPRAWLELPPASRVVQASGLRSSYHARNAAARGAEGEWLLFLDADCRPPASLLDDYLRAPVAARCGLLAGEVEGVATDRRMTARWLVARRHLEVRPHLTKGPYPAGITANLMLRRSAWEELGGFAEVRSGADLDLCWRAAEAGWSLRYRPEARVGHLHAGGLRPALRRARRYGPGQAWLEERFPGAAPRPPLAREVARALAGVTVWTARGQLESAAFKGLDGLWAAAYAWGYYAGSNDPR